MFISDSFSTLVEQCTHDIEDDIAALEERVTHDVERQIATRLDAAEDVAISDVREAQVFLLDLEHLAADVDLDDRQARGRDAAWENVAL